MKFEFLNTQKNMRLEAFRMEAATITGSFATTGLTEGTYRATCKKTGTGDWSLTLGNLYTRRPIVIAQPMHATLKLYTTVYGNVLATGVLSFLTVDEGGTVRDPTLLDVMVYGADTADQIG
jgi:hypothetical protein